MKQVDQMSDAGIRPKMVKFFPDGPKPTARRYCMNGTALTFAPDAAS